MTRKRVTPDPIVASVNDYVCWMWPKGVASSLTPFVDDENDPDEISFSIRLVCVCNKFLIFMIFYVLI